MTDGRRPGARPHFSLCEGAPPSGAALEVGHILGLVLNAILRVGELVLLLALALLAPALGPQGGITGDVTCCLLGTSRDLVDEAHTGRSTRFGRPETRIG